VLIVKMRNVYKILVGKSEQKILLGGYCHREENHIKMDLKGIKCEVVDYIQVAQDRT